MWHLWKTFYWLYPNSCFTFKYKLINCHYIWHTYYIPFFMEYSPTFQITSSLSMVVKTLLEQHLRKDWFRRKLGESFQTYNWDFAKVWDIVMITNKPVTQSPIGKINMISPQRPGILILQNNSFGLDINKGIFSPHLASWPRVRTICHCYPWWPGRQNPFCNNLSWGRGGHQEQNM